MRALFLSKLNKQYRGWIALIILLASLLGTHWIGFAHGIAHSGIHHQSIELSCADQEPSLGHSTANCHLLDALSLAGFIASDSSTFGVIHSSSESLEGFSNSPPARLHVGLYQSRAPPAFIL